ncbi:methylmalonyl-CoA mutase family protein [Candidatus Palauibacter soopunensis]|uniref:acyl-CoA mutase large subunit family protein n=1 Tax=Candidatus Palauibacter soopunensis TaxID=3056739 RepID=UPI002384AF1E|nr:methylmalonyl-CoA mutase family protein [Candidatus Palauibacter soopunensis]MDE2879739.1 methylmalonyl-CoA mutase family protein [Candidatus Palauibacter soopunensis]
MNARRPVFSTASGIEIDPVYEAGDANPDPALPGEFPYTRGVYPTMYRGRLWTMRQYAGFGTAAATNARFRYLLDSGQTGLSVAFDLPTQMGYDSDDARVQGEVGRVGVAIDSIEDMHRLFEEIPLERVSTAMTINATAPVLLAMYAGVAQERGIDPAVLRGTVQNDVLKEFIARGTYIYPVEPSVRFVTDVFDFCSREMPRWRSISISGYHIREAGATAAQELAFTIANGLEYVRRAIERGLEIDDFAPGLSFFFSADRLFFEEVAKFRAARRMWARLMRDRFGAAEESCRLKFHTQTSGAALTAQQPLNNVVRVAIQALSAVLGGTQSLHTNSFDEALSLPGADAARLALRTQQILAAETGVGDTVDPLGGSYFVESLTDDLEERAREYLARVEELGGPVQAIDYMREEIHLAARRHQEAVESRELEVVGVNVHADAEPVEMPKAPDFARLADEQRQRLTRLRAERSGADVEASLAGIRRAAAGDANLLPVLIDAVRRRVTLGEISHALREVWGEYRPG